VRFDFSKLKRPEPSRPRIWRYQGETWDECIVRYCKQYGVHHDKPLCTLFQLERELGPDRAAYETAWLFGLED